MKKIIFILFLLVEYAFAGLYSIQLYSATQKHKKLAIEFYNELPANIKKFSFIYTTNSNYVTVRYLVKDSIKKLKPYTKNLHHFSFVNDSKKKVEKFLLLNQTSKKIKNKIKIKNEVKYFDFKNKLNTPKETNTTKEIKKNTLIKEINATKESNVTKTITQKNISQKKQTTKKTASILPDWAKMDVALYEFDTYKIRNLLQKNINTLQRIDGLDKIGDTNKEADEIFAYKQYGGYAQLWPSYFELIKKKKRFLSYKSDIYFLKNYTNQYMAFRFGYGNYGLKIDIDNVLKQQNKDMIIDYEFTKNNQISIGWRENSADFVLFEIKNISKIRSNIQLTTSLGVNQKSKDSDEMFVNTKNNNIKTTLLYLLSNRSRLNFDFGIAQYYYQNGGFIGNKTGFELHHYFDYSKMWHFTNYIKIENYSTKKLLNSYKEIGSGFVYGVQNNILNRFSYYINPSILYNTYSGLGYGILFGADRRLFRADELRIELSYYSDTVSRDSTIGLGMFYCYWF